MVRTVNYQALGEGPQALVYLSLVQYYFPTSVLYIRTTGDPAAPLRAVRKAMQTLDRNFLLQAETLETSTRDLLWAQRLSATLLAVFGGMALLLSTIGIYGVISYNVRQRRREIGIRIALGATPANVQSMVVREGVRMVLFGVVAGVLLSFALAGEILEHAVFGGPARCVHVHAGAGGIDAGGSRGLLGAVLACDENSSRDGAAGGVRAELGGAVIPVGCAGIRAGVSSVRWGGMPGRIPARQARMPAPRPATRVAWTFLSAAPAFVPACSPCDGGMPGRIPARQAKNACATSSDARGVDIPVCSAGTNLIPARQAKAPFRG